MHQFRRLFLLGLVVLYPAFLFGRVNADTLLQPVPDELRVTRIDALNAAAERLQSSNAELSVAYAKEAQRLSIAVADDRRLARSTINLGVVYRNIGQTNKALDAFIDALRIAEKNADKYAEADAIHKIGVTYLLVNEFDDALAYGLREEPLWKALNDDVGLSNAYNFLGLVYLNLKNAEASRKALFQALDIARARKDTTLIYKPLVNLGDFYIRTDRPAEAIPYIEESLALSRATGNLFGETVGLQKLGLAYMMLRQFTKAETMLNAALENSERLRSLSLVRNTYRDLARLNEESENYKGALAQYRKYVSLEDSLFSEITKRKIAETVARYEIEKKEQENEALRKDAAARERVFYIVAGAALSIFILSVVLFILYNRQREMVKTLRHLNSRIMLLNDEVEDQKTVLEAQNEALTAINSKKDRFFSILAHDVRAAFAGVIGFSETMVHDLNELNEDEIKLIASNILRGTRTVNGLFENLLQWSRLELNDVNTVETEVDIGMSVTSVLSLFDLAMERKNIKVQVYVPPHVTVTTDEYIFNTVLRNLISNAIKFSNTGGKVFVSAVQDGGKVTVTVKDEGVGIPPDILSRLFSNEADISRPGTMNERGTGLGLHVCKRLCDKIGLQLTAESEVGYGTTMRLTIES
jgi:signal transduction histidine kinase